MAAILAIAGIVMMTYADGFHSHSVIGIALVVGSASMSALYKVGTVNPPSQQALGQQSSGTHSLPLQTFRMVCRLLRRAYFFSMHREADSTRAGSSQAAEKTGTLDPSVLVPDGTWRLDYVYGFVV